MIDDIIDLIDPPFFDNERLIEVVARRIQEEQRMKSKINTTNNSKQQLNRDLAYILHGKRLRSYGEIPQKIGLFEMISPSETSTKLANMIKRN